MFDVARSVAGRAEFHGGVYLHVEYKPRPPVFRSSRIGLAAGENGLLLTPSIDHLFDRGFISFQTDGRLLVSPVAHRSSLERMGVPVGERANVGAFSEGQRRYLEFHQERVFLAAKVDRR